MYYTYFSFDENVSRDKKIKDGMTSIFHKSKFKTAVPLYKKARPTLLHPVFLEDFEFLMKIKKFLCCALKKLHTSLKLHLVASLVTVYFHSSFVNHQRLFQLNAFKRDDRGQTATLLSKLLSHEWFSQSSIQDEFPIDQSSAKLASFTFPQGLDYVTIGGLTFVHLMRPPKALAYTIGDDFLILRFLCFVLSFFLSSGNGLQWK